ncbi:85/88 kDa calcium-independent phospholipase A2 [Trichinella nativa]|uniref:phospholipase A2 n=1 Tax=Trichinella nativa TaxID=6335 RepID=A0A0V1L0C3_9BILA|nr:85/88 kDa calcium-independent phospholipase A2 [Trichinella nativa]
MANQQTHIYQDSNKINQVSKFVGNMVSAVREKVMGESWWLPSSSKTVVEIPTRSVRLLVEQERHEQFAIFRANENPTGANQLYHVVLYLLDNKMLSLRRFNDSNEASNYYNMLVHHSCLFQLIDNRKALDTLLDCIQAHSLWLPVHVAAKLGMKNYFELIKSNQLSCKHVRSSAQLVVFCRQLSHVCQPEGCYPLHIAVESGNVDLVVYMIDCLQASLTVTDIRGQTPFHYAARTSPTMIAALACYDNEKSRINALSKDGYTPLFLSISSCKPTCTAALLKQGAVLNIMCNGRSPIHMAMLQSGNKLNEMIKTLVEASPDCIYQAEKQTGNSALHVAGNKQALNALLSVCPDINLNCRNNAGQTALHLHTYLNNLSCVVALYYHGADLNAKDTNGNTSLHIAVSAENESMTKALLVLGADPNIVNDNGHSPRHTAARLNVRGRELMRCLIIGGAIRCPIESSGCAATCSYRNADESDLSVQYTALNYLETVSVCKQEKCIKKVVEMAATGKKFDVLLSLDGGGIRGVILILLYIEAALKKPLISYVTWLAGTSTGGFLAAGLAKGMSLRDCQKIYLRMKDCLFEGRIRPYQSDAFEQLIKANIGETSKITDIVSPKLIITTVLAEKHPVQLHMFRNYTLPGDDNQCCTQCSYIPDIPLWKVLRCSSAAPTYFDSVDNKFVDGGLIANNPALDLLSEFERYKSCQEFSECNEEASVGCLLSIGTGRIPDMPIESLNLGFINVIDMVSAFKNLGYMVMDQVTAAEGRPVDRARSWCHCMGVPFFRFSTPMSKDYALDTKSDQDLIQMMWETLEYVVNERNEIARLVELLNTLHSNSRCFT